MIIIVLNFIMIDFMIITRASEIFKSKYIDKKTLADNVYG